jgi:hypothetical protein
MRGGGIILMVKIFIVLKGILSTEAEGYVDSIFIALRDLSELLRKIQFYKL